MVFDRLGVLASIFGRLGQAEGKDRAAEVARRWQKAFRDQPELVEDLIVLSGLFHLPPQIQMDDMGRDVSTPICPIRAAQEQGARDLALKILAAGKLTINEINYLMESE
jgi:hypothetical protein